jgi:hypothetical protein
MDNAAMPAAHALRAAEPRDLHAIVALIGELADFEHLTHLLEVTPDTLAPHLFGERPVAECLVGEVAGNVVAFALFFTNFSTFLARPGLYLEDLYVRPRTAAAASVARCSNGWAASRPSAAAAASSGACSTGTRTRSASTRGWAPP